MLGWLGLACTLSLPGDRTPAEGLVTNSLEFRVEPGLADNLITFTHHPDVFRNTDVAYRAVAQISFDIQEEALAPHPNPQNPQEAWPDPRFEPLFYDFRSGSGSLYSLRRSANWTGRHGYAATWWGRGVK